MVLVTAPVVAVAVHAATAAVFASAAVAAFAAVVALSVAVGLVEEKAASELGTLQQLEDALVLETWT